MLYWVDCDGDDNGLVVVVNVMVSVMVMVMTMVMSRT